MDTHRRIDLMEEALTRQVKTNAAADTKVSTLIGIDTTMLAVLAALINRLGEAPAWTVVLIAVATGALLFGILFLSLSSVPRTSRTTSSVIFFGSIARMSPTSYGEAMRTISAEAYLDDLIEQTHRTAEIATQKFRWIQRAQQAWYIAILPWLLAVYTLAR